MNYQNYLSKKAEGDPTLKKRVEFENWILEIGINAAKIRKENGYSQECLASKMNVKQSMIARIEAGHNVTCETIWKLSKGLNTNVTIFEASTVEEAHKLEEFMKPISVSSKSYWHTVYQDVETKSVSMKNLMSFSILINNKFSYNEKTKLCISAA